MCECVNVMVLVNWWWMDGWRVDTYKAGIRGANCVVVLAYI